jgi:hypothetical protein
MSKQYKPPLPPTQLRFRPEDRDEAVRFFRQCGLSTTSVMRLVGCGWNRVKRVDARLSGKRSVLPPEMLPQRKQQVAQQLHLSLVA